MPKKPIKPFEPDELRILADDEIEDSYKIRQSQTTNARLFASREDYAKSLPQGIRYLEVGVAWGYSAEMVAEASKPVSIDLLDWYNQDFKCWSWRKFGSCQCDPRHTMEYDQEDHEDYIKNKFSKYNSVTTIRGDSREVLPILNKQYDYIYIDIGNARDVTRSALADSSLLVPVGGLIGLNDYLIYDGVIEDMPYGTFQTVNEFLHYNSNWSIDALALHPLGFYDIYLRRDS
jgi:predicted O-methyltransferase YrrM